MKLSLAVRNLKSDLIAIDELELNYEIDDAELDSMLRAYPEIINAIFDALDK